MKSFPEFINEALNKTHDEDSQSKLWNYFISNPEQKKIRDLILDKDYESAQKEIKKEVEAAKKNKDHPLNFANAGKEEFSKAKGREESDEQPYNKFLDDSISGLLALSKQRKLRSAVEKGLPTRVTGSGQAELSRRFKGAGGTDKTPKGDVEVYDPDNPKYRVGVSMKKGTGAQLASAEGGELKGMYKNAAKSYVRRFHGDKSKEEQRKIQNDIMKDVEKISDYNREMKTSDRDTQKDLKGKTQDILNKLGKDYPQLTRLVNQVATSGDQKFKGKNAPGTAGVVLTGKEKNKEATAAPSEQQKSQSPRAALPKGRNRPGNIKIDYKPEKEKTTSQGSLTDFLKSASSSAKEANSAVISANKEVKKAESALTTYKDGKPIPRQYRRNYANNNPQLRQNVAAAQSNAVKADQNAAAANQSLANMQQQASQAMENQKREREQKLQQQRSQQQQRTQPVDTRPQQPQQQPQQPQERQNTVLKRRRTPEEIQNQRDRMASAMPQ